MMSKKEWMDTHTLAKDKNKFVYLSFEECIDVDCNECPFWSNTKTAESIIKCKEDVINYIEMKKKVAVWKSLK